MLYNLHIPYDNLLMMDISTIQDFHEWLRERDTNRSKLTDSEKEFVVMAKKEREAWAKQK